MVFVKCPIAFRPRRLAQTAPFYLKIFAQNGSSKTSKRISIAQARTKFGQGPWSAAFYLSILAQKGALAKRPSAFRLPRLAQSILSGLGLRHFACIFLRKMALVKCPNAFRRRSLAQFSMSRSWSATFYL